MEVDRLAQLAHDLGAARVDARQQALEHRRVGQVVAARVAREAVVGAHDHERRLAAARAAPDPSGAERRVERDA